MYKVSKKKKKQSTSNKVFAYIMLVMAIGLAVTTILPYLIR